MKLNLIALVATVAVVSACSTDDKKGAILTPKTRTDANRTADSKGKIPGISSKAELAAAKATVEAPAAQPTLSEAAHASYKLLVEAGSQAFRKSLQESQGNVELSLAAARDAIISKVNEIGTANHEAVALALVMIADAKVSEAFYQGKNEVEAADLAKFNADETNVIGQLSAQIKTDWETKKGEAELNFANISSDIAKKNDEVTAMEGDLAIEQAKDVANQNVEAISSINANIVAHKAAIEALTADLSAQKALIAEYSFMISQIENVGVYVATRVQAVTPEVPAMEETPASESTTPASDTTTPAAAPEMAPETPASEAPEAPASETPASEEPASDVEAQ